MSDGAYYYWDQYGREKYTAKLKEFEDRIREYVRPHLKKIVEEYYGDITPQKLKIWEDVLNGTLISMTEGKDGELHVFVARCGSFQVHRYPACCGLYMFHHFNWSTNYFSPYVPEEWLFEFLDFLLGTVVCEDGYAKNRRYQIMMVSKNTPEELDRLKLEQGVTDYRLLEIPNLRKPEEIRYPIFYKYFKSKQQCRERLFYNSNSRNTIHELEVIIN